MNQYPAAHRKLFVNRHAHVEKNIPQKIDQKQFPWDDNFAVSNDSDPSQGYLSTKQYNYYEGPNEKPPSEIDHRYLESNIYKITMVNPACHDNQHEKSTRSRRDAAHRLS